ncbi:MAG: hypothetical protein WC781_05765 [Candidatus Pacearchaeota archaeon]|jgi:hypothetical protein
MNIFSGINVSKEAKEMKIQAYQSDIDTFNNLRQMLNDQIKNGEGEIKEEEIFSRMVQFANASINGEAPKNESKKVKKVSKNEVGENSAEESLQ